MKFTVWSEGYVVTGNHSGAVRMGTVEAEDFKEACNKLFSTPEHKHYYDPKTMTYWGCKLFDNVRDASRSFGPPNLEDDIYD